MRWAAAFLLSALVVSCGQKGPLELPGEGVAVCAQAPQFAGSAFAPAGGGTSLSDYNNVPLP